MLLAAPASAQTIFGEVEPNNSKSQATAAFGMADGDSLRVFIGCPPPSDADIFRVRPAPRSPGIWRHRLVSTILTLGSYPAILGRPQYMGSIVPGVAIDVQEGVDTTSPQRFLQWYGFGGAEEVFVDIGETQTCRSYYDVALESTAVAPTQVTLASPGFPYLWFDVEPTAQSPTTDLDFVLLDADFDVVPGTTARRTGLPGMPKARVSESPGRYYLGVGLGAMIHSEPAAPFDTIDDDPTLDFRGAVLGARPDFGASYELTLHTGTTPQATIQGTFSEPYEIQWYVIDIGTSQNVSSFCIGDGAGPTCACATSPTGHGAGCANSSGRGGHLVVHGPNRIGNDLFLTVQDLPIGAPLLLFVGPTTSAGSPVSGGALCLGPGAFRVGSFVTDWTGTAAISLYTHHIFSAGVTYYAQAAYRDVLSQASCWVNLTNGESFTIRP